MRPANPPQLSGASAQAQRASGGTVTICSALRFWGLACVSISPGPGALGGSVAAGGRPRGRHQGKAGWLLLPAIPVGLPFPSAPPWPLLVPWVGASCSSSHGRSQLLESVSRCPQNPAALARQGSPILRGVCGHIVGPSPKFLTANHLASSVCPPAGGGVAASCCCSEMESTLVGLPTCPVNNSS